MLSALLIVSILLDVARELCFKVSARCEVASFAPEQRNHVAAFFTPSLLWVALGAVVWIIEILAYAQVLARLPLNIAFPVMSLTYAATPFAGWMLLGEPINPQRWAGIALVTVGVMIIGSTGMI